MRVWVTIGALALSGCGARVEVSQEHDCESASWATHDGPAIAAEGTSWPFSAGEVLIAKLGPFNSDVFVDELDIGAAPGWGCDTPAEVQLGMWTEAPPAVEPTAALRASAVLEETDIGDGFTARRVALPDTFLMPAGTPAFVGFALSTPASCGAKAIGPAGGLAWRWREHTGWTELDGRLVVWARGCELP